MRDFDAFWKRHVAFWREEEIIATREGDVETANIYRDAREALLEALPKWERAHKQTEVK
jgi:hypothetical protein